MKLPITLLFPVLMTLVVPTIASGERMVKIPKRERSCGSRNGTNGHHGSQNSVATGSSVSTEVDEITSSAVQSTVTVVEAIAEPTLIATATDAPVITTVSTASQGSQESVAPPLPVQSSSPASTDMAIRGGLGWNSESLSHMTEFTKQPSKIHWAYSWGLKPEGNYDPAVEFVPMVWGRDDITQLETAKANWPAGTNTILSFNEPDMGNQANLNAAEAAKLHTQWATSSAAQGFRIGAPATARGGKKWFTDFDAACKLEAGCDYDFIPIHFYGDKVADFITYVQVRTDTRVSVKINTCRTSMTHLESRSGSLNMLAWTSTATTSAPSQRSQIS